MKTDISRRCGRGRLVSCLCGRALAAVAAIGGAVLFGASERAYAGAWAGEAGVYGVEQARSADTVELSWIELDSKLSERASPLAWLTGPGSSPTLRDVVTTLEGLAQNSRSMGVVVRIKDAPLTLGQVAEIGHALTAIRESGRRVHMFCENMSTAEVLLGSYADEVILQAGGMVMFPGMYMEEMFLADMLGWAGMKADFVQVGDYKGAAEALTNTKPSEPWDDNINRLLDELYGAMRATVKRGRSLNDVGLDRAMAEAWMMGPAAKSLGLIDTEIDLADLTKHLERSYDATRVRYDMIEAAKSGTSAMDLANPFAMLAMLSRKPDHSPKRATIAVVHIDGAIVDGDSSEGGFFGGGGNVGSRTIRNALKEIEDNDLIKGVVLRINSPGGSATASEVIWRGVRRVAAKKPVWVSVGDMAASGGYYIAVGGSTIYLNPSSIVGSIGVVGGKIAMGGTFDKLKVNVVGRARGPRAAMLSVATPWTNSERQLVRDRMTETYDLFTSRVSAGRPGIDLSTTAEGRLFAGESAVDVGLADRVGSLSECITDLALVIGLADGAYDVMSYPGPVGLEDFFKNAFGGFLMAEGGTGGGPGTALGSQVAGGVVDSMGRSLFGDRAWPGVRDSLNAMALMRDQPVLLVSPRAVIVR